MVSEMNDDLGTPRWLPADVRRAVGVSTDTLRNWMNRKPRIIVMSDNDGDRAAAAAGQPALFSLRRVVQVGIIHALVNDHRIEPRVAADAALLFTHAGMACHHFPEGDTFLAINGRGDGTPVHTAVVNSLAELPVAMLGTVETAVVVNVTRLEERIRITLGLDYEVNRIGPED